MKKYIQNPTHKKAILSWNYTMIDKIVISFFSINLQMQGTYVGGVGDDK